MLPILSAALATPSPEALDPAVVTAVRAFATAADARDLAGLEAILHPEFRVLFTVANAPGVKTLPRAVYTGLAREGKVGGVPRTLEVLDVRVRGDLAWADVRLDGPAASFSSLMTLARADQGWLVVEDATVYAPKP